MLDEGITDFKNDFEAAQAQLQSRVNKCVILFLPSTMISPYLFFFSEMLPDLKQLEISTIKSKIEQIKEEQEEVNAEIDEILKSLAQDYANK